VKPPTTADFSAGKPSKRRLPPVVAESGRPLYLSVRDALRSAIDHAFFRPGEQMPSTKELSEQMGVSLVTAHRALQELVACGVLQRSQGKGTFIHDRYPQRKNQISQCRVGLVMHRESSIADYYHGQILEGVRRESDKLNVDLLILRFGEDVRNECNGFLYLNPLPSELEALSQQNRRQPTIVVGARSEYMRIGSVDVDNIDLARQAVIHLKDLGHRNLLFVGGADQLSNSRDRHRGFVLACEHNRLPVRDDWIFSAQSWRLSESEREHLISILAAPEKPTAVFAAGYYMALDVYGAAQQAGLRIPEDLSVICVDDPPSAEHLSPPLTTMRQPLVQLGQVAVATLTELVRRDDLQPGTRSLWAELIVRASTAKAK
jgi:LacI family transcriptional regulator